MTAAPIAAGVSATLLVIGVARFVATRPPAGGVSRRRAGLADRHPLGRRLARQLARAGAPLGADAALTALAGAMLLAAGGAVWLVRQPLAAPVAAAAVLGGALAWIRTADRRYAERIARQLAGVAQHLASGLSAGLSLRQALTRAARDAPEPSAGELRRVVRELEMGARVEAALEGLAARVGEPSLTVLVTAILVQRRAGGNLARALANLAERLDERVRLDRELRSATAQARLTAWMVGALPFGAGVLTELAAPGTIARTLGQGPGLVLLLVALVLYGTGVALIRRVGRVEA